jgi:multidrug efflux pump subunit AcrA (membrane-fusion protein)
LSIDDSEEQLNLQSKKSNFLKELASVLPDFKVDFPSSYPKWKEYFESVEIDKPIPELPPYSDDKEKTFLATKNIFSSFYDIKRTEVSLRKYHVYAPFDGTITQVYLQVGSFVNPGVQVIKIIRTDESELKVAVEVPDVEWIKTGSAAKIYSRDEDRYWTGYVSRIGEYVNQNTQSIDVFIEIHNEGDLYDGQYLQVMLKGPVLDEVAEVPREAVFDQDKVYVLEDSLLKVRKIDVLKINQNSIVFNGLKEGSDLVIEPLLNAYNNMRATKSESRFGEQSQNNEDTFSVIRTANTE